MKQQLQTEFSRTISLQSIGTKEYPISIEATSIECSQLAIRLGLVSLNALTANLCLFPKRCGRIFNLRGSFQATVIQTCVVTLDSLSKKVEGNLDLLYDSTLKVNTENERNLDIDENIETQDFIEPFIDGYIDIGEAVSEQLALEIDFFPRKDGVSFVQFITENKEKKEYNKRTEDKIRTKNGPFSVLATLQKNKNIKK
jgi:uncharacterized metal-binding protein YceD (DUF177 family)